jgi:NADH-quinone oxidoreductase subunit H
MALLLLLKAIPVLLVFFGILGAVPLLVFLERKISAWIQSRIGPNRVGLLGPDSPFAGLGLNTGSKRVFGGLLQPAADVVKLFTKELIVPAHAEKALYFAAPLLALLPPLLVFAVIPVGPELKLGSCHILLQVADLHIGILWFLAVASLSAYGIALGGWASNNKFSLLGGVRAVAQMLSYEVGLGLVILAMIMTYETVSLREIVLLQTKHGWGLFHQPLAFLIFIVCAFAENNRLPFDLPECESELVGGYHTEYSSMAFGMFFQGEYIAMLAIGALLATLFLGGWHYPGYAALTASQSQTLNILAVLLGLLAFGVKTVGFVLFSMWVRWTLPRFRWDQLLSLGWRGLVPLALVNLLVTAYVNLIW